MCLQLQGTSDKPTLHKMWCVIYFDHLRNVLHVRIQMYMYMPNHLVHHVPATTASSSPACCMPSTQCVPFSYLVLPRGTQFYLVELRSTTVSLLASQLHKYVCMYITC